MTQFMVAPAAPTRGEVVVTVTDPDTEADPKTEEGLIEVEAGEEAREAEAKAIIGKAAEKVKADPKVRRRKLQGRAEVNLKKEKRVKVKKRS